MTTPKHPQPLTLTELSRDFDRLIDRLVADGASAEPVIFGAYRRREAVMVFAEWYEERLPIIEKLLTKCKK